MSRRDGRIRQELRKKTERKWKVDTEHSSKTNWQKYILCSLAPVKWKVLVRQYTTDHTEELTGLGLHLMMIFINDSSVDSVAVNGLIIPSLKCQKIVKKCPPQEPRAQGNVLKPLSFLPNCCLKWFID